MNAKSTSKRYFWKALIALLLFALSACGSAPAQMTPTSAASFAPTVTLDSFSSLPRFPTFTPSRTPLPTLTPWPTITPITFTPTPPSPFPLDGYVAVFKKDGALYFQDENNAPVRLTHGEEESHSPIISDDNKKVVFLRGEPSDETEYYSNIYSVNTDGSEERALITSQWLAKFGEGAGIGLPSFLPGTHQLRFSVFVCDTKKQDRRSCISGLFLADTDTGNLKELITPRSDYLSSEISPDGKMIAVNFAGHIDILDMNGEVLRQDIFTYTPSAPVELYPETHWLSDSKTVIVALPISTYYWAAPIDSIYAVWRYTIETNAATQIHLDPPPALTSSSCTPPIYFSPDQNWGLYNTKDAELYLWNLKNGTTQLYNMSNYCSQPVWSPGSKYFAYGNYLFGSVDGQSFHLEGIFFEWFDANRFFYADITDKNTPTMRIGEIIGETIQTYEADSYLVVKPKR